MSQFINQVGYGLSQALINQAPRPIQAKRAPTTGDVGYLPGTLWCNLVTSNVYVLAKVASAVATWLLIEASGGAGVFSSLTVTPGPISLTGTTSINTSGAAVTTIGTGGTGAVNIGNATGNTAVTGNITATGAVGGATLVITGTGQIGGAAGSTVTLGNVNTTTLVDISAGSGNINLHGTTISTGTIAGTTLYATGDAGGVALTTGLTNATVVAGGTSAGMVVNTSAGAGTTASAGFLKLYVGATAIFVPYWTQTT